MTVTSSGYTLTCWLLPTRNRYEPAELAVTETPNGLVARADALTYGDGSGSTPGPLIMAFARHERGFSWQARAEPIRGILVARCRWGR